jgi:hypothetical protein
MWFVTRRASPTRRKEVLDMRVKGFKEILHNELFESILLLAALIALIFVLMS